MFALWSSLIPLASFHLVTSSPDVDTGSLVQTHTQVPTAAATSFPRDTLVGDVSLPNMSELTERLHGKSVLCVGATRGIGRGVALALARAGASVSIAGRSVAGGAEVVSSMKARALLRGEQHFRSYSVDLFTVKGALNFTRQLQSEGASFDYLVFSVGAWPNWKEPYTVDGVDKVIALDLIARYLIFRELAPSLHAGARVLSILGSAYRPSTLPTSRFKAILEGKFHSQAYNYKLGFDTLQVVTHTHDAYLVAAAERYQPIRFIGTFPGKVDTEILTASGTFPKWLGHHMLRSGPGRLTEEECGENHAAILVSENVGRRPATFFYQKEARYTTPLAYDQDFHNWVMAWLDNMTAG